MMYRRVFAPLLVAALLACLALPVWADQVKGRIAGVRPDTKEVVVTESFKNWKFELTKESRISINGRDATLSELRSGDEAVVTFEREGQRLIAGMIRCKRQ
jgi:hypothetical protein